MTPPRFMHSDRVRSTCRTQHGFVLVVALWISLVLSATTIYFAHSVISEIRVLQAESNRSEARQALRAAERYYAQVLNAAETPSALPDVGTYLAEAAPVGNAHFWVVGRADEENAGTSVHFELVDEGSKLNLNVASKDMLLELPGMTETLAASLVDWRDEDETVTDNGAETETYSRKSPSYTAKNSDFESLLEIRLVNGADTNLLFGRDRNRNGVVDTWEKTGDTDVLAADSAPSQDYGLLEYLTVWSRSASVSQQGQQDQIDVNDRDISQLQQLVTQTLGAEALVRVLQARPGQRTFSSLLEFYVESQLKPEEFSQIDDQLTASTQNEKSLALVNVNTALEEVLACLPGIDADDAEALAAHRRTNSESLDSLAWVVEVIGSEKAVQAGPYITTKSYVFSADVAAIGDGGRGYQRAFLVFDTSDGEAATIYRRDRSDLGWALGTEVREEYCQ